MTAYLIFTIVTGVVMIAGVRIYLNRALKEIDERDRKFQADIARVRKLRSTPAQ